MITAWVVGRGGLLGSAIGRRARERPGWQLIHSESLPWIGSPADIADAARRDAIRLREAAGDGPWAVVWAAGAAVTSSGQEATDAEYDRFVAALAAIGPPLADAAGRGMYFLASSAGGVYAGSSGAPFTEHSAPRPLAAYGNLKLRMERALRQHAEQTCSAALIGRIANLYGPGQRLDKMQGIISHLARARLTPAPASVFVPLDTLRDYLYVDDAADLVLDALARLDRERGIVTKILASGEATSIAAILGHLRALSKARPRVVLGSSPAAQDQALDLRLRSVVWPELDAYRATPLAVGIDRTIHDIEQRLIAGTQSASTRSSR
jgi:UDP-glucose 4-epimerase